MVQCSWGGWRLDAQSEEGNAGPAGTPISQDRVEETCDEVRLILWAIRIRPEVRMRQVRGFLFGV